MGNKHNNFRDRQKSLSFITGILAGAWPCGVITLLGELYVAESKAQVYGFLHAIIHKNDKELSSLHKANIQCCIHALV